MANLSDEEVVLYSGMGLVCGSMLVIFGFILHNKYAYSSEVSGVIHLHYSVLIVTLVGIVVCALGLIGMLYGVFDRHLR